MGCVIIFMSSPKVAHPSLYNKQNFLKERKMTLYGASAKSVRVVVNIAQIGDTYMGSLLETTSGLDNYSNGRNI